MHSPYNYLLICSPSNLYEYTASAVLKRDCFVILKEHPKDLRLTMYSRCRG